MERVDPVRARVVVQSALPRDQTIYFCAPADVGFAAALSSTKALMLLFGAMMSFSTRTVSENFNESKPIAFSIYNVLFTACIIIPIGLLNQSDGRTLYLLGVFAIYWITLSTFSIVFAPKVIAIYKDASGLLAQRISDSKASGSDQGSSQRSGGPGGRTIKELSQQPIRLMDRGTLRTYVGLLEKELTMARAALATLDANEGVLAAAGHIGGGAVGARNSGLNLSRVDAGGVNGGMTPTNAGGRTTPLGNGPRGPSGSYPTNTGGSASPKGGSGAPGFPTMQRTASTAFTGNKYGAVSGGSSTPQLSSVSGAPSATVGVRSIASIAPLPPAIPNPVGPTLGTPGGSHRGGGLTRGHTSIEMKTMHHSIVGSGSPSHSGVDTTIGDDGGYHRAPETRFRMPGSQPPAQQAPGPISPINNHSSSHAVPSSYGGMGMSMGGLGLPTTSILSSSGINLNTSTPSPTALTPTMTGTEPLLSSSLAPATSS
jgi:hypothetical protein